MKKLISFTKRHKYFLLLSIVYFLFRFINLTLLPIFNDEAIYLDWGWRETHHDGELFYSLYDGKQPLLMWIFGLSENFFKDPLFAGRLVSVLIGFLTLLGIYTISRAFISKKTAFLASMLYISIPIFSFFDRQALMESSIAAVGIWSLYFFIKLSKAPSLKKYAILLGITLGIGLFIKSSTLIFILTLCLILIIQFFRHEKNISLKSISIIFSAFLLTDLLLLIDPSFWTSIPMNSRYSLTLNELIHFPTFIWITNMTNNFLICFFALSPLVFLGGIIGSIAIFLKNKNNFFTLWFVISFLLQTFFVRNTSQRYIVAYLPLFCIFAGYFLLLLFSKNKLLGLILGIMMIFISLSLTILQILNPASYILLMAKTPSLSPTEYVQGNTSGYGISQIVEYIQKVSSNQPKLYAAIAENTGNPESAMNAYFQNNQKVQTPYLDSRLLRIDTNTYDCIKLDTPLYFISRNEETAGLGKFFQKLETIKNPYSNYSLGIYKLKVNCKGKVYAIQLQAE